MQATVLAFFPRHVLGAGSCAGAFSMRLARLYNGRMDVSDLPGGELIVRGLADLAAGELSVAALIVAVGGPCLSRLGVPVPTGLPTDPEHELYARLAQESPLGAHARYNALIRRLVSFEHACACAAR